MTDTTDDYGYLLVHFIEDPDGYAEKIYMDISDGDNPHRWVPLNDGKPVLASHLGTTGVRDPHIIRNPDTGTWYIIATDLRVFGGDGGGWYEWSHHASTNLIIWESDDLLHWSEPRMLDVSRKPDGSHLELGMAWACECLWVPDYYPQGHHGGRGAAQPAVAGDGRQLCRRADGDGGDRAAGAADLPLRRANLAAAGRGGVDRVSAADGLYPAVRGRADFLGWGQ